MKIQIYINSYKKHDAEKLMAQVHDIVKKNAKRITKKISPFKIYGVNYLGTYSIIFKT